MSQVAITGWTKGCNTVAAIKELREKKFVPGTEKCRVLLGEACSRCGIPALLSSTERGQPQHTSPGS